MTSRTNFIHDAETLDLTLLNQLQQKPLPFAPGEPLFWDDPYISAQLLSTHLDITVDRASRKPETIDASVSWLMEVLRLNEGDALLDLGCGPGLYATRLAWRGLAVTGVDFSKRSIAYAQDFATDWGLEISYREQDYLKLTDEALYDAVLLIFGEYCTFNPNLRRQILASVHRALKPGGYFVLDVSTRLHRERYGAKNRWEIAKGGFWRPGKYLLLTQGFDYTESMIYLNQTTVIEEDGSIAIYRHWFQDYDRQGIETELIAARFAVQSVWSDLIGTPYSEESEWIGVVAKKESQED